MPFRGCRLDRCVDFRIMQKGYEQYLMHANLAQHHYRNGLEIHDSSLSLSAHPSLDKLAYGFGS